MINKEKGISILYNILDNMGPPRFEAILRIPKDSFSKYYVEKSVSFNINIS